MNRQQRRKREREFKKRVEESIVGSNHSFSIMREVLVPHDFQLQSLLLATIENPSIYKKKISPGLIFDNGIVRAVLTVEKKGVEITTLLVYEDYLSQGYGKLMLDFLLVTIQKAKVDFVSLYPQKKDPYDQRSLAKCQMDLENFYSKRGFEWNKGRTEMVLNWEKFEVYEKTNKFIENLDFERILNPRRGMGLMAA
jgi:hypothetical protein